MLATIRDKATGWVAGIIVGALIISFAFWGVSSYFGAGNVNVANVNGSDISLQSFQRSFYNLRQQMQSLLGGDALSLEEEELVKEQTIQRLVETELVNQLIKESGLRVANRKVVETIKNLDYFKDEEGFDRSKYERSISSMGMDPVFFEAQLRMDLLSEQLQAGLSESLFVLDSELQNTLQLRSQTRDLTYTILSLDSFMDDREIPESEIEAYYQANPSEFADPEKVKIEYLELDVNDLAEGIEFNEEEARAYYQDNKDQYDVVEQRSVSRLFVKIDEEATEEEKQKAEETINAANALVVEGKTLEEVIEQFNADGKGLLEFSEHAFMAKGVMEKEIDEFLFSADEGAISDVIKSEKGLSVVKVGEVRGGPKNIYENSAEQVEKDYKQYQAELQFFELADQLTTLSYEHADTLEIAAEAIEKEIIETDFITRNNESEGVLSNAKVISESFDPERISTGENSDAIEISDNHIVVLRVVEHKSAATKLLDEVRDEVINAIRTEAASHKIVQTGKSIVEQLEQGNEINALDTDIEIEWSTAEKIKRDDVSINRAVLRSAFQSGKPVDDKPVVSSNRLGSGDYAIVMVTAAYEGEVAEDEETVKPIDLELRRTRGNSEWQDFIQNVKSNADITIFKENI